MNGLLELSSGDVEDRLSRISEPWLTIVAPHVSRAARDGCFLDPSSGALLAGHEPRAGALSFQIRLFPPASEELLLRYERTRHIQIPSSYRHVLSAFNGAFFYQFALYGIDEYLLTPSPRPRASVWASADIWVSSAVPGPERTLVAGPRLEIGARNVALNDVVKYMEQADASVIAVASGHVRHRWPAVADWLASELGAARDFAPTWTEALFGVLDEHRTPRDS
jgi:hypothetical protein